MQDAELPQFTIKGFETNERKIKLATGTYQVSKNLSLSKNLSTEQKNCQTNIFVSHHQLIKQRDIKVEKGGIILQTDRCLKIRKETNVQLLQIDL